MIHNLSLVHPAQCINVAYRFTKHVLYFNCFRPTHRSDDVDPLRVVAVLDDNGSPAVVVRGQGEVVRLQQLQREV